MRFREPVYHSGAKAHYTPIRAAMFAAMERQRCTPVALWQWQLDKLNAVIANARTITSYYRHLPAGPLKSLGQIRELPTLTKAELRQHRSEMISHAGARSGVTKTTGRSTGAPVTVLKTRHAISIELAATWRGMSSAGVCAGDEQAPFWGVPSECAARTKATPVDVAPKRFRCSAFPFADADLRQFHRAIFHRQPTYCYGYVSMLRALCHYIISSDLARPSSLNAVVTSAEPMTQIDRRNLQLRLNTTLLNKYGCGELGTIAHECEHHSLHENQDTHLFKILDDQGTPVRTGKPGHIVITDLFNYATPLIRYHIADPSSHRTENCPCGRGLPVLDEVAGREYDILINKSGDRFHGEFFLYIFEELTRLGLPISAFRITQTDIDDLTLEIAADSKSITQQAIEYILWPLRSSFSNSINLNTTAVKYIPREQSRKLRIVRRLMEP